MITSSFPQKMSYIPSRRGKFGGQSNQFGVKDLPLLPCPPGEGRFI